MPSSRDNLRHRLFETVSLLPKLGKEAVRGAPESVPSVPGHLYETARQRAGHLRASPRRRWLIRLLLLVLTLVGLGAWYEGLSHRSERPVDPQRTVAVQGAPSAVLSYSELLVSATGAGRVSALDPLRGVESDAQQLQHPVASLATRGGFLYAIGGGRITRMGTDLSPSVPGPVHSDLQLLASGEAGLWAAGDGTLVERIDANTLKTDVRIRLPGAAAGLAVSSQSVWVAVPATSQLVVVRRQPGQGFKVREVPVGCEPGPVTIADGRVWTLCPHGRRVVGVALADVRNTMSIPVQAGSTLLVSAGNSLYVASPRGRTLAQYGTRTGARVGKLIALGALPSAVAVDVHAAWVGSSLDHTIQRVGLSALALQGAGPTEWDTFGGLSADVFFVIAVLLTVLLPIAFVVWRSCNPDAGLPRRGHGELSVLAVDPIYHDAISSGEPVEREEARKLTATIRMPGGAFDIGGGDATRVVLRPPTDSTVQRTIASAARAGRIKHFMMHVPGAGVWLARAPRQMRVRPSTLEQRYATLRPFTLCWLSGQWIVSRVSDDAIVLQLPELVDRSWWQWRVIELVHKEAWISVACPASALTPLGNSELEGVSRLRMSVLAVPSQRDQAGLQMNLVVACYEA